MWPTEQRHTWKDWKIETWNSRQLTSAGQQAGQDDALTDLGKEFIFYPKILPEQPWLLQGRADRQSQMQNWSRRRRRWPRREYLSSYFLLNSTSLIGRDVSPTSARPRMQQVLYCELDLRVRFTHCELWSLPRVGRNHPWNSLRAFLTSRLEECRPYDVH